MVALLVHISYSLKRHAQSWDTERERNPQYIQDVTVRIK